jgi:hypothetical protein
MNFRNSAYVALAIVLTFSVASAAAPAWPKNSASDLSIYVTMLRFRIYADHCSAKIPELKPKFDGLLEDLNNRIQGISKGLLASEMFKGMQDRPVPMEIVEAFKDSFNDSRHNLERQDAAFICPETLRNFGEEDDESLKSRLTDILTAVQNMIRNLEKEGAGQAWPNKSLQRVLDP